MAYLPNPIDSFVTALIVVDEEQHWTHSGMHYVASYTTAGLAAGSTANLAMVTPNTPQKVHCVFDYQSNTQALFRVYEGVTFATTGSALLTPNLNRQAVNSASSVVRCSASASNFGTTLYEDLIGFSGGGAASPAAGNNRDHSEFVLKSGTNYMFFASAQGAGLVSMGLNWYEI